MLVLAITTERGRHRPIGIKNGHHMTDPNLTMRRQLIDTTNCDLEGNRRLHCSPHARCPWRRSPQQFHECNMVWRTKFQAALLLSIQLSCWSWYGCSPRMGDRDINRIP